MRIKQSLSCSYMYNAAVIKSKVQCLDTIWTFQNIRIMAKYYTRIRMKRMGELLDLTEAVSKHQLLLFLYQI